MDLSKPHCFVETINIMLLVIRRMAYIKQRKMIGERGMERKLDRYRLPKHSHTHWNPVLRELAKYALSTEFSDLLLSMLNKN